VDQNLATVLSSNFSICETNFVPYPSERDAYRLLVQQANAQGITYVALTGDTGPASCETQRKDAAGLNGINVMSVCPPRFRK
jgi:subtilase family serine protease